MSEIYVITSGKGGVGKTTTTANLGMGLAMRGKKVVLVDTDTGLRNLDLLLGLENRIMYDLIDVTEGRVAYKKALVRHKKYDNLFLLPTSQVKDKMAVNPEQLVKLCSDLRQEFDYILIDCPAGIEQGFKTAIAAADTALVVTMPEISAVRDADKIIGELGRADKDNIKLIVNRIRPQMVEDGDMLDMEAINDILSLDCIGQVPDDLKVVTSTNKGEPCVTMNDSEAGQAYRNIVGRMLGEDIPFMEFHKDGGWWKRLDERRGYMLEALMKIFGKKEETGKIARDRLKVVLIHDRANISPEVMDNLKNDIIKVISNYMEINQQDMDISLANDDDSVALVANIPVSRMKHDKGEH